MVLGSLNGNNHLTDSNNEENTEILMWFDQYDLLPHPEPFNFISPMNIYRVTTKFLNQLIFLFSQEYLVQEENHSNTNSLIFYSFSTLLFNLSKTIHSFHTRLSLPLFYNKNLRLGATTRLFLAAMPNPL